MQARKVALFLPDLAGGGAERVALSIAGALAERGCQVDLLLVRRRGELLPAVPSGVRLVELGGGRILGSVAPLVRYLRQERPFALHAFMWPLTVVALAARGLARVSTRVSVSDHTTLSQHASGSRERRLMRWTIRRFYPAADARVQVSEGAADDLAALGGIPRRSVEVLPNPLIAPASPADKADVDAMWGVSRGERVLTVGSLKETKDHATLLRAFARLSRPRARLMIVGDGELGPSLRALGDELGITEQVIWAGFQLDPWPFYASADLFVLASRLEGQPMVLLEAMASGRTVVSTDCPHGPREMLNRGEFGRLVPVGDEAALARTIDEALASPADPKIIQQRAAELSGSESMERHLQLMLG